ncbi:MgtC/SapB family protein [Bifidobacterium bombi]|uniref:MgtC family magnesium (Mg2+) transporter n=2 Tax=Bifidobacterium bombi TaxID=471511 RepID=A0A080N256_9BIFI|nr:MgtC/SapB family protein [Bifidobacterium bombi]KFF31022.1 MgtC family magnesium (Mg2+) transporter [Bifidobacterium bombi DSM 19703]
MTLDLMLIRQAAFLFAAFVLSTAIGTERQLRHKDAGIRTHALVGVGSALFVIISKYGFMDVISANIRLDPSRIAAQIVSGIGFIGAGLVFTQRSHVRGLTTAASIWLTAAIGSACGAGMVLIAAICTVIYFLTVMLIPYLTRNVLPGFDTNDILRLRYKDGHGTLRSILALCAVHGVSVEGFSTHKHSGADVPIDGEEDDEARDDGPERIVTADLEIRGKNPTTLIRDLTNLEGVLSATRINNVE